MRQPGKSRNYEMSLTRNSSESKRKKKSLRDKHGLMKSIGTMSRNTVKSRRRWATLKSKTSISLGNLQRSEMVARLRPRRNTKSYRHSLRPRVRQLYRQRVRKLIRGNQMWQIDSMKRYQSKNMAGTSVTYRQRRARQVKVLYCHRLATLASLAQSKTSSPHCYSLLTINQCRARSSKRESNHLPVKLSLLDRSLTLKQTQCAPSCSKNKSKSRRLRKIRGPQSMLETTTTCLCMVSHRQFQVQSTGTETLANDKQE